MIVFNSDPGFNIRNGKDSLDPITFNASLGWVHLAPTLSDTSIAVLRITKREDQASILRFLPPCSFFNSAFVLMDKLYHTVKWDNHRMFLVPLHGVP
jgi:hypothetical protein